MTFQTCLGCHGAPQESPAPVRSGYLPDRHHLRIDTPIDSYSASPFPENSPDGTHKCVTCHEIKWIADPARPNGGYFGLSQDPDSPEFRDCLNCHVQQAGVASVHHLTRKAQEAKCHLCHGSLIDNPNGGHRIPDYQISFITPWPGDNYDTSSPSNRFDPPIASYNGRRKGNCAHCHYSGTDLDSNQLVYTNRETHHGTGVGQPGSGSAHDCGLCHDVTPPNHTIRGCQRCHGIDSLHNIEFDRDGSGIEPGGEEPFWGHIGSPANCRGCHGNFPGAGTEAILQSSTAPTAGANIVPTFVHMGTRGRGMLGHRGGMRNASSTSDNRVVTFSGSGFVTTIESQEGPIVLVAHLLLTNRAGTTHEFEPVLASPSSLEFMIPGDLPAGSYDLQLVKGSVFSPLANLVISPEVSIKSASCDEGKVTIRGSGFSSYLDAEGSGTALTDTTTSQGCAITSWSDSIIEADCGHGASGNIRIDSVFGSTSIATACSDENSSGGRPRWWSIWSWWASWSWARR